jgi:Lrp/AsnC family leucine-responsive transcriptional regulator
MANSPTDIATADLDAIDRNILKVLQREGRISNADLAERIALSPSACHRRVKRLEDEGVIKGYAADVDPRLVGRRATIYVSITLNNQSDELMAKFEQRVQEIPDVIECYLMSGAADYMLKVMAEDTEDFAQIHRMSLSRLPGVAQMQSNFALRTVFKSTALPLESL